MGESDQCAAPGMYSALTLAHMLNVTPGTVRRWATEPNFPQPKLVFSGFQATRMWSVEAVRAWVKARQIEQVIERGGRW